MVYCGSDSVLLRRRRVSSAQYTLSTPRVLASTPGVEVLYSASTQRLLASTNRSTQGFHFSTSQVFTSTPRVFTFYSGSRSVVLGEYSAATRVHQPFDAPFPLFYFASIHFYSASIHVLLRE